MFPNYEWLLLLFPLIGVIVNGLFGHRLPRRVVAWVGCLTVGLSFVVALSLLLAQLRMPADAAATQATLYQWISAGAFKIDATLLIDPLSVLMAVVVTGVSLVIHVYSAGYMAEDPATRPLFHVLESVRLLDARPGHGQQLPDDVRWVGGCGPVLLPVDRLLVRKAVGSERRQEGIHRQPRRRLWFCPGHHAHLRHLWHAGLQYRIRERIAGSSGRRREWSRP